MQQTNNNANEIISCTYTHKRLVFTNSEIKAFLLQLLLCVLASTITAIRPICAIAIVIAFFVKGYKNMNFLCASYLMLTFWDNRLYLPGNIPVITILKSCLILIVLTGMIQKCLKVRFRDLILLVLWIVYSAWSVLSSADFSGISMVFDLILAIYICSHCCGLNNEDKSLFWKEVFFALFLSSLVCTLLGYFEFIVGSDLKYVYISGQSFARFRGVVGVDRYHFIACMGMIYPLYYMKSKIRKIILVTILSISVIMTLSITALVGVFTFYFIFFNFRYKGRNKWKFILLICVLVVIFCWVWLNGSGVSFIDTMINRMKKVIDAVMVENYDVATSSRTSIWTEYMNVFKESHIITKLIGTGYVNQYSVQNFTHYSHNTYIDFLLYFGLCGSFIIAYRFISSIRQKKRMYNDDVYQQMFLLKVSTLITGLTVSAMTADYWLIFFLL